MMWRCSFQNGHYKNAGSDCNCIFFSSWQYYLLHLCSYMDVYICFCYIKGEICFLAITFLPASFCLVLLALKSTLRYSILALNSPSMQRRSFTIPILHLNFVATMFAWDWNHCAWALYYPLYSCWLNELGWPTKRDYQLHGQILAQLSYNRK